MAHRAIEILREEGGSALLRKGMHHKVINPIRNIIYDNYFKNNTERFVLDRKMDEDSNGIDEVYTTTCYDGSLPDATGLSGPHFEEMANAIDRSPRQLFEISNGVIIGDRGLMMTEEGKYVLDSVKTKNYLDSAIRENWIKIYLNRYTNNKIFSSHSDSRNGPVVSLIMHTPWDNHYGHWLVECLPELFTISQYEQKLGRKPQILISNNPAQYVTDSLEILGYPASRVTEWENGYVEFESILKPITSRTGLNIETISFSPIEYRWLREQFQNSVRTDSASDSKRIYVSRQDTRQRKVINFGDVKSVMKEFDIKIIQPEKLSFEEQVRIFSNCELIVGPFGSGLHNMIFSESTKIVEIFPPNYKSKLNKALAYALGHRYMCLFGLRAAMKDEKCNEGLVVERSKDVSYKNVSFEVHPESLRTVLKDALSG